MSNRERSADLEPDVVIAAAREFRTPRMILQTSIVAAYWVALFWGGRYQWTAICFSAGAICTGAVWATLGWKPWAMKPHQMLTGRALPQGGSSPIQQVTATFFRSPRCRMIQGLWVASGALLPWLIYAVSALFGGRPFMKASAQIPWWAMVILGIVEGVRGRATALYALAAELEENWPRLLREAAELDQNQVA